MNWKKIMDTRIEEILLVITMVIMVLLVFSQSALRYLLGTSFSWSSELARFLHIWQIWIGASFAIRKAKHVSVTLFVDMLPRRIKFFVNVFALLCWFAFALFFVIAGSQFVNHVFASGQKSPGLELSMWIPYLVIPISGVLMAIRLIQNIYFLYMQEWKVESEGR